MISQEYSCGIVVILRKAREDNKFLVLKQETGNWSFPKGHKEENETSRETALRELYEETHITNIELTSLPTLFEEYDFERDGVKVHKINEFFIGFVSDDTVVVHPEEIVEYVWAPYDEVMKLMRAEGQKLLKNAVALLSHE